MFGKRRIKTLKDLYCLNQFDFLLNKFKQVFAAFGDHRLSRSVCVLRPWSLHWMRSLGAVAKVADLAAEKTVPLPCRTKKWRNLTSSLQKRKAEYHLQGTLALSACQYSMFCFSEQINAVLRSAKHIRALLFLDILNQKPPRRLAPIEVRFRLSAERFLACTSNFEPLAV